MYAIVTKEDLTPVTKSFEVRAPDVARKAQAGQFVIVRVHDKGERIPLTIADHDRQRGTLTLVVQEVGKTTMLMGAMRVGDRLACAARVRMDSKVRVWGSRGEIEVPVPWNPPEGKIVLHRYGADEQVIDVPAAANAYTLEADVVVRSLPERQAPYPCMTWADSLGNMRALDAWRAAVGLVFEGERGR